MLGWVIVMVHMERDEFGNPFVVDDGSSRNDYMLALSYPDSHLVTRPKIYTYGNAGNDTILFSTRDDNFYGGTGNDTLKLAFGSDRGFGGAGNDTISVGYGTHYVEGGSGDDTVQSTASFDFAPNPPTATDGIIGLNGNDTLSGGSGFDTLSYAGGRAIVANLSKHTVKGFTTDTVTGFERLIGGNFADNITGSRHAETLEGGNGNDVIRSLAGADKLAGGKGSDTFVFAKKDVGSGNGFDRIKDFAVSERDRLDLHDFAKDHPAASVEKLFHLTDTASGTLLSGKVSSAFVPIAFLEGVHGVSVHALITSGLLIV
jgi:Ca2+-binding RTX toxin-like protein